MKKAGIASVLLISLLLVVVATVGLCGLNVNLYRVPIAMALSERLGHDVRISGDMTLKYAFQRGVYLAARDVHVVGTSLDTASSLIDIGNLEMSVELRPLLSHHLSILSMSLSEATIQIEAREDGTSNLDVAPVADKKDDTLDKKSAPNVQMVFGKALIENSRLIWREKGKPVSSLAIGRMEVAGTDKSFSLYIEGASGSIPVVMDLNGEALSGLFARPWRFNVEVTRGEQRLSAQGQLDYKARKVALDNYVFAADKTNISGSMLLSFVGARPYLVGSVISPYLDLADVRLAQAYDDEQGEQQSKSLMNNQMFFSFVPLNTSVLKAIDASLDLSVDSFVFGLSHAKGLTGKVTISNGLLLVSPLSMKFGASEAKAQAMFDASGDVPQFSLLTKAYHLDFSELIQFGGVESLLDGKADLDLSLNATGRSPHELASHMNGSINLVMANGSLNSSALRDITGMALDYLVVPGAGLLTQSAVHCLAARFKINNGLLQANGVLVDTALATFSVTGGASLSSETLGMNVSARSSAGIVPPMRISGTLAHPQFSVRGGSFFQGILSGVTGKISGGSFVPEVTASSGQNACVATLDHTGSTLSAVSGDPGILESISSQAKNLLGNAGSSLQGLLGGLGLGNLNFGGLGGL